MQKKPFTVADYLLTRLKQLNVTEVFQIPGDYVKHFTQALEDFPGITTIGAINELDAAYAADAYGRTRGLGAVSLQYGVSTFSALNAIAGAFVERSPVVVISATPGADSRQITKMYDVLFHHSLGKTVLDEGGKKFIGTYSDAASIESVRDLVPTVDCFLTFGTIITDDYLWFIENKYAAMVLATTEQIRAGYFIFEGVTMKDFM